MENGRLLLYEGWDLANSTALPTYRWTTQAVGSTVNVQNGGMRVALAGVAGAYAEWGGASTSQVLTTHDYELLFDVTFSSVTAEQYSHVFLGDSEDSGGASNNGVGVAMWPSTSQIYIQRRDAGVETAVFTLSFTFTAATTYRIRFRREGPSTLLRIWSASTIEPTNWSASAIEYGYRQPYFGCLMLGLFGGNVAASPNVTFDNVYLYELTTGRLARRRSSLPASANLGTATGSFVANNLSRLGQYNLGTTTVGISANGLSRLGQYNLGTTTVGISANGLSRLGQYNLGTAALGLSAFGLSVSVPVSANLSKASLGLTAKGLGVATGDIEAWNSTLTDWNSTTVDWNAGSAGTTANLGTASLSLNSFAISGSRILNSAALAFVANAIAQTRTFSKADLTIDATALDPLSVGAEPIGQGRTLPSASLGLTAYNFTYGGQVLPGASVALAAALLGSSRAMSAATLGVTAYGLTVAAVLATANLGTATVGFTANPLTLTDSILVIAASLGITANALGFTDSLNVGTATLGLTASNLADSETTTAASLGLSATGLASSRALGTTTVPFSASGMTTAGYALASASITAIANNLSLLGSFSLGNATVAFSAFGLTNQTTGQATLGRADFSVSAANLSVGLSAGLSASLAMSATNLARAAVVGTSSLSVAALGLTQLRTAALGLASLVTTAYDMSQSAPGSAALGSGTLLLSANPMTRFALLSAGLATVALDANAIQPKANVSGAVGSMSTAAQPMSSTRALAKGILDLTAYGFGTYRPSTLSTAALTITAYALSAQTGKSKGRISVRNGYVQFKTGGRGLTGSKVANPVSSFKTVGG